MKQVRKIFLTVPVSLPVGTVTKIDGYLRTAPKEHTRSDVVASCVAAIIFNPHEDQEQGHWNVCEHVDGKETVLARRSSPEAACRALWMLATAQAVRKDGTGRSYHAKRPDGSLFLVVTSENARLAEAESEAPNDPAIPAA